MDEELKATVKELKDLNISLMKEVMALKSQVSAMSQGGQPQQQQQEEEQQEKKGLKPPEFTSNMPSKFTDPNYISTKEKREICFAMVSNTLNCLRYDEGRPAHFYNFMREGEEEVRKPTKDDGMTAIDLGVFTTPMAGRYRFDVRGVMEGRGKAEWYLCCAHKENMYEGDSDDNDSDSNDSCDDSNDDDDGDNAEATADAEAKGKKKSDNKEKERLFKEGTRRHLLMSFTPEDQLYGDYRDVSVGIDCGKDVVFWTECLILEGTFQRGCNLLAFSGRLVC